MPAVSRKDSAAAGRPQATITLSDLAPILCECTRHRRGEIGPHRDAVAELERARRLGLVPDEPTMAASREVAA